MLLSSSISCTFTMNCQLLQNVLPSTLSTTTYVGSNLSPSSVYSFNAIEDYIHKEPVQFIRINGRKVYKPHNTNSDDEIPPANSCEIYVKHIPRDIDDEQLISYFSQFGTIWEFRIMVDFQDQNRGFGYVRYLNEFDALKAIDLLNHFYLQPFRTLHLQRSYDKCRLYVGNIPRNLSYDEVKEALSALFFEMVGIVMHTPAIDDPEENKNRGYVFVDFCDHGAAIRAKQLAASGRCSMWGNDLKIVWANPQKSVSLGELADVKTLFLRNIDTSLKTRDVYNILTQYVPREDILKLSRVRDIAFVELISREVAMQVKQDIQVLQIKNRHVEVSWAIPPSMFSMKNTQPIDFDTILRLKCIANDWKLPTFLFGRLYETECVQYAAVIIGNSRTNRVIFAELNLTSRDIQSRLSELVVSIIEMCGGFPDFNYVTKLENDKLHIVGAIIDLAKCTFLKACNIKFDLKLYSTAVNDLCTASTFLCYFSREQLLNMYSNALSMKIAFSYLPICATKHSCFGCVPPQYRPHEPMKHNLDNSELIFALCDSSTLTNYNWIPNVHDVLHNLRDEMKNIRGLISYHSRYLMPMHAVEPKLNIPTINLIKFGIPPCV